MPTISIAEEIKKIDARAEARIKSGCDPLIVEWQSMLEVFLYMMQDPFAENPGQLLAMQIEDQEEWECYQDIQECIDLPPETCAVLMTPSAFRDMPIPKIPELDGIDTIPWERDAYSIIISNLHTRDVVMHISLPGIKSVGMDVYEEGNHLADYSYNTIKECLEELTKTIWIYFNPKGDWTEEQIIRYTENWYAKSIDIDLEDTVIHEDHSYVHHPELLNLTPLESVFKVIAATIPKAYDSLDKAIEIANDINQGMDLGYAVITKEGILKDNKAECQALLNQLILEIDQHIDTLQYLEVVEVSLRTIKDLEYNRAFDDTAKEVYQTITGRPCLATL